MTDDELAALFATQPSLEQMFRTFISVGLTPAVLPELAQATEHLFKIGACFALFTILHAFSDPEVSADRGYEYLCALEDEGRAWIEAMARADSAEGN